MPRKARCKFTVETVEGEAGAQKTVKMRTQYDEPLTKEDEAFSKYTPWGEMSFGVDNPALEGFFQPGKDYYIDITPVE